MTEEKTEKGIQYDSNNSGGGWWLSDEDWFNLEKAGWVVKWYKDDPYYNGTTPKNYSLLDDGGEYRFLGALASNAVRYGLSEEDAIAEWESITGENAYAEGCSCCGRPHSFYEEWYPGG